MVRQARADEPGDPGQEGAHHLAVGLPRGGQDDAAARGSPEQAGRCSAIRTASGLGLKGGGGSGVGLSAPLVCAPEHS